MVKHQCLTHFLLHLIIVLVNSNVEYSQLQMVHVVFRHGERTPPSVRAGKGYPRDPHWNNTYFPFGNSGLTNEGMRSMFKLGSFLRRRYNNFLGDIYQRGATKVRSTGKHRAMASAELVTAGLWPPSITQQWTRDLLWLPIPYEYVSSKTDSQMYPYKCPKYIEEYKRIYSSDEAKKRLERHRNFFAYLSEHTGKKIATTKDVFFLYHFLEAEVNCNLTLPSWTKGYFPNGEMYDVVLLEYDIANWSDLLKRIFGGSLIREVLYQHTRFIQANGSSRESSPKITLYSGHDSNIYSILKTLDVWFPHMPDFSSAIMFELLQAESNNEFGIRVLYFTGRSGETIPLTVPGCTEICPISEFNGLLSNVIPNDFDELCGMNTRSGGIQDCLDMTLCITLQIWILYVTIA